MAFGWKLGLFSSSKLASASHGTQDEEDFLAPARVLLAVVALVTVYVDPAYHGVSPAAPAGVLILYLFHSLLVLKSRLYRREWIQASRLGLHVVDLLCAVCVPLFIGAQRPYLYYAFFVFVLLAAAYRWGLKETLLTAVVCITFLLIVAIMLAHGGWESFYRPPEKFDVSYFARRAGYLFVIAYIVGFVGEKQVEVRLADAAIARLIGIVHSQTRIREALGAALGAVMETFGANYAALVLKEEKTQRAFLWQAELRPGVPKGTICWEELENFQHRKYFFSLPGISCHAVNRPERTNEPFDVVALGDNGQRLRSRSYIFPEYFTDWHPFGSILVISFTAGQGKEWLGRLFVFDPRVTRDHEAELRLLRDLVREATPAAYTVYRLRRLRSRASEMERARIALELHDGVVQTLASIEMKVEALRRNRSNADRTLIEELNNIERQLR